MKFVEEINMRHVSKHDLELLFFNNVEPNYPEELAERARKELRYFEDYLWKAIKGMRNERYNMAWEKDENLPYVLFPNIVIKINKPRNQILINIAETDFDPEKPILKEDGYQLRYKDYIVEKDYVNIILSEGEDLSLGEKLYYGHIEIDWKSISSGFLDNKEKLTITDRMGNKINTVDQKDTTEEYIVQVPGIEKLGNKKELFIGEMKIDYEIVPLQTLKGLDLFDRNGQLSFSIEKESHNHFIIYTTREIRGKLINDNMGRRYFCKPDRNKKGDGIWIALKESDEDNIDPDADTRSKSDIFMELLSASIDSEIWEAPNLRSYTHEGKIKVIAIDTEENRLLLEKEPSVPEIYPPKNTYQLRKQTDAIRTLIHSPSPAHRNLLRLFEPADIGWEVPSQDVDESMINWKFLEDESREGTDEQKRFVIKALNTPDFSILEGPPGSGKTMAITELIYHLITNNKRVLLSSSTHVAVDNVLEKLDEKFSNSGGPMQNGIVPLRIGKEARVSEDIKPYQIENRIEVMRKKVENEEWFQSMNDDEKYRALEEIVAISSNIVCGTTIGILQYSRFKRQKQRSKQYILPEFDYLIIDEASKTTFQEFLVPAINARRWIIVGDIRQLSPYTDTLQVRVNLDGVLNNQNLERALVAYLKLIHERRPVWDKENKKWPPKFLYVDEPSVNQELMQLIIDKTQEEKERVEKNSNVRSFLHHTRLAFITNSKPKFKTLESIDIITEEELSIKKAKLFDKHIVVVDKNIYKKRWGSFPPEFVLIKPDDKGTDINRYRHLHWYKSRRYVPYGYPLPGGKKSEFPWEITDEIMRGLQKNWAGELAWRLKRVHELTLAKEREKGRGSKGYYLSTMHALMPPKKHGLIWNNVNKIGQMSLTSLISSLQEGIRQFKSDSDSVMSTGFERKEVLPVRYEKLSYQHRMHPDISALPREIFYQGQYLQDDTFVSTGGRDWGYGYKNRAWWIDVSNGKVSKNVNDKEAQIVLRELEKFINWAKSQKTSYDVVILSFYERQRKHIRDLLRDKYPNNRTRRTRFDIDGIKVRNYTVDKVQGREGDIVFLSMVQNRRPGFLDSPNRLNVAITRAKYQLVIIGDRNYFLTQKNSEDLRQLAEKFYPKYQKGGRDK